MSTKPAHEASITTESSEEDDLDQHVKDVDVSKKGKKEWLKRSHRGVWAYLKKPRSIITGHCLSGPRCCHIPFRLVEVALGPGTLHSTYFIGWTPTSDNTKENLGCYVKSPNSLRGKSPSANLELEDNEPRRRQNVN